MARFRPRARPRKPLPVRFQVRLAGAGFRAARKAAEAGRCRVAEFLYMVGGGTLKAVTARKRNLGTLQKALGAASEGTMAGEAIAACWARQRETATPGDGT